MQSFLRFLLATSSLVSPFFLLAQQTTAHSDSLSKKEQSSYWKADVNYLSNAVYNGRKDSLAVPYLTPSIGYYHKSGLYADASMSILASSYAFRPDLTIIEAGYNFDIGKSFSGSLSASKYFSSKQSVSVRSEVRGTVDASAAYNVGQLFKLTAGGSLLFNTGKPDLLATAGISHEWDWGKDSDWSIEPMFTVNAGSQNYFDNYKQSRTRKTGKAQSNSTTAAGVTTTIKILSLRPKRFVLLDYEISAPLYYDTKKWGAYFTPTFAIPQSPDTYSVTTTSIRKYRDGTTDPPVINQFQVPEHIENSFYATVGVYFIFK